MQTPPFSAMFDQWQNYQKSYMDAWQSMAESSISNKQLNNPWTDALDKWWQTLSKQSSPDSQDLFAMLIEQGKTFFNLTSTIHGSLDEAIKMQQEGGDWEQIINKSFDGLRGTLAAGSSSIPMELWSKFVAERFQPNGDLLPNFVRQFQEFGDQMLNMPGIGQSREKQEKFQKLAKQLTEYQSTSAKYIEVQTKISNLSVDLLQKKIGEMIASQQYPESYRDVYDVWVDCYEEVYAEAVMQPEYNTAYGEMVNSLMGLTLTQREVQDDALEAYGMPSRRELDTLHRRFQEERREKHKLRAELEALKAQVEQLKENQVVEATPKPAKKPATRAKSTSTSATTRRTTTRRSTSTKAKSAAAKSTK